MTTEKLPPIFKYIEWQYANAMVQKGAIRVRPLTYYVDEENLGKVIGDRLEGSRTSSMVIKNYGSGENVHAHERDFLSEIGFSGENVANIYMSEITISTPQYYAYCTSVILSYSMLREFCGEENGSIVTIPDLRRFYDAISEAIAEYADPAGCGPVMYINGQYDYRRYGRINPCYIKQFVYSYQAEVRMIWTPKGEIKEFIDLCSPRIADACCTTNMDYDKYDLDELWCGTAPATCKMSSNWNRD